MALMRETCGKRHTKRNTNVTMRPDIMARFPEQVCKAGGNVNKKKVRQRKSMIQAVRYWQLINIILLYS
jgi:hypothetical protein